MRSLLVVDGDRNVLIDCGMGDKMDASLSKYYFLNGDDNLSKSLEKVGVKKEDITDVIFSHLHFDHCGGAVERSIDGQLSLAFPNAKHWVSKSQWESALAPNRREKPSFIPENFLLFDEAEKLHFCDEGQYVSENIQIRLFNGHTKGLVVPLINFEGRTLVYISDFIPTTAHVPLSYVCGYDIEPLKTIKETEQFLEETVTNDYVYFFEHDLYSECCSFEKTAKGVKVKDKFSLLEFIESCRY